MSTQPRQEAPESRSRTYEFGVREKGGFIAGIRTAQIIEVGIFTAIGFFQFLIVTGGWSVFFFFVLMFCGFALAITPMGKRNLDQWVPIVAGYAWKRLQRHHRHVATMNLEGQQFGTADVTRKVNLDVKQMPRSVRSLRLQEVWVQPSNAAMGVLRDTQENTLTACLMVRGERFALMDLAEQESAVRDWGQVEAEYGLEAGPISRIQWIERQVPDDGSAMRDYLEERAAVAKDDPARRSYESLIQWAGPATPNHTCLLAIQIDLKRPKVKRQARKMARPSKGTEVAGGVLLLARETFALQRRLQQNRHISVGQPLTSSGLAMTIRSSYRPEYQWLRNIMVRNQRADDDVDFSKIPESAAWPRNTVDNDTYYLSDGMYHRTYWVSEWPRQQVGPAFMSHLLLLSNCIRTISVISQPEDPRQGARSTSRTRDAQDIFAELRRRTGFREKPAHQRAEQKAARDEMALTEGHVLIRYSAYVTISAVNLEDLDAADREIRSLAARCGLELEFLWGQQEDAFLYGLPTCRGLGVKRSR